MHTQIHWFVIVIRGDSLDRYRFSKVTRAKKVHKYDHRKTKSELGIDRNNNDEAVVMIHYSSQVL